VKYGYLAAGGGAKYSEPLRKLNVGNRVMAYQRGAGYVGYGVVTMPARPIHEFALPDGQLLASKLNQRDLNASRPEDQWEYAVGVKWLKRFPLSEAQTFKGVFANPNIVCKLSDRATAAFVRERFGIDERALPPSGNVAGGED
jgi:hypothetical protein